MYSNLNNIRKKTRAVFGRTGMALAALLWLAICAPSFGAEATVVIRLEGNRFQSAGRLQQVAAEELKNYQDRGQHRADADDAAFQMAKFYLAEGWAFAEVNYRQESEKAENALVFSIVEGPRVYVRDVRFTGNQAFPDSQLRAFYRFDSSGFLGLGPSVWVADRAQAGEELVREIYHQAGYNQVQTQMRFAFSEDQSQVTVEVEVSEGERLLMGALEFQGEVFSELAPALDALRTEFVGQPLIPRRLLMVRNRVAELYGNHGYPNLTANSQVFPLTDPGHRQVTLTIDAGEQIRISGVEVEGNEKTQAAFILSRLQLRAGDLFRQDLKRESFNELYATGLFSRIDLDTRPGPSSRERILIVRVEETPSQEIYLEPGWGSYELLRIKAGYQEKNLFGTGRIARLAGGLSFKGEQLGAGIMDPWLFGSDLTADLPLDYRRLEEPSFTRQETSASLIFGKRLLPRWNASLGYQIRRTLLWNIQIESSTDGQDSDYRLGSIKVQTTYDTRDDLFFPRAGQSHSLAAELSLPALGGELAFARLNLENRLFLGLTTSTVLGLRYDTGVLLPAGDTTVLPVGELFFNGGENTVRSFSESALGPQDASGNPSGGLARNTVSLELRQWVLTNLAATLFVDYGNIVPQPDLAAATPARINEQTWSNYFKGFRMGVGIGMQYLLPVGPVRLDLAFNPSPDAEKKEAAYQLHFSVGMAF